MRKLAAEPPLAAKYVAGPSQGDVTLWLVGSGASLLEDDELTVSLQVCGASRLAVRSVAAQLVHPCTDGRWASYRVEADVGPGARLDWRPEPVIVAGGARYRAATAIRLAATAGLTWQDELVLGRTGESATDVVVDTRVRIDVDGAARWRDGLASAPGWLGPAVLGPNRYIGSKVTIGCGAETGPAGAGGGIHLTLADGGTLHRVLAADAANGRLLLQGTP